MAVLGVVLFPSSAAAPFGMPGVPGMTGPPGQGPPGGGGGGGGGDKPGGHCQQLMLVVPPWFDGKPPKVKKIKKQNPAGGQEQGYDPYGGAPAA